MKIAIAFSVGGHYNEAMKACTAIIDNPLYDIFYVTYKQSGRADFNKKLYYVTHPRHGFIVTRMFLALRNLIDSFGVYLKEKPDLVISTGADVTLGIMLVARLFKKKLIFIESGANVTKPSLTGRLIYKYTDVFIIQWPDLLKFYPKAITGINLL